MDLLNVNVKKAGNFQERDLNKSIMSLNVIRNFGKKSRAKTQEQNKKKGVRSNNDDIDTDDPAWLFTQSDESFELDKSEV